MAQSRRWSKSFRVAVWSLTLTAVVSMVHSAITLKRNSLQQREYPDALRLLMDMRKVYPIVPLGERLPRPAAASELITQISEDAERELSDYEGHLDKSIRRRLLMRLHEETFAEFVERNGFGQGRMWFGLTLDMIKLPSDDSPPIPIDNSSSASSTESLFATAEPSPVDLMKLPALHRTSLVEFVDPIRLGLVPQYKDISKTVSWTFSGNQVTQEIQNWAQLPDDSPLRPLSVAHTEHGMSPHAKTLLDSGLRDWRVSRHWSAC